MRMTVRKKDFRLIHGKANLNKEYATLTNASNIADDIADGNVADNQKSYEAFIINQWFSGKKQRFWMILS